MELDQLSTDFGGHDTKGERKTWTGIPRFYLSPDRKEKKKKWGGFCVSLFYKLYSRLKTVLVLHVKTVWTGFMGPTVSRLHICMRKRNEKKLSK